MDADSVRTDNKKPRLSGVQRGKQFEEVFGQCSSVTHVGGRRRDIEPGLHMAAATLKGFEPRPAGLDNDARRLAD